MEEIDISSGNSVLNVTAMYNLLRGFFFFYLPFIKNLRMQLFEMGGKRIHLH